MFEAKIRELYNKGKTRDQIILGLLASLAGLLEFRDQSHLQAEKGRILIDKLAEEVLNITEQTDLDVTIEYEDNDKQAEDEVLVAIKEATGNEPAFLDTVDTNIDYSVITEEDIASMEHIENEEAMRLQKALSGFDIAALPAGALEKLGTPSTKKH